MIKTMRYRSVVIAKAATDADEIGLKAGTEAYANYIKSRVAEAFDESGRALDGNALAEARATTFQQDLLESNTGNTWGDYKSLGALWQQGVSQSPALRLITPFVKTPANLFRYGVKLTPGLNLLQKEYVNAISGARGAEDQARAIGQMMLGTLFVSSAVYMRLNGQLTGSGPSSAKMKAQWQAQGNQPYSLVIQDGDRKTHIQLSRLDPIQAPFALAADVVDILMQNHLNEDEEANLATAALLGLSHQLRDKTFLKNLSDFMAALTDDNRMKSLPQRTAPGFIPWSTLFRNVNPDPYLREVHTFVDSIKATLPGYSSEVPKRYDVFGDPVTIPGRFVNEQKNAGPLARALDESYAMTGNVLLPPNPRVGTENLDLREITLESGRNAYERYQELTRQPSKGMPPLKDALTKLVGTDTYKAAPHGRTSENSTKEWMMFSTISDYRKAAMERLKGEDKTFRERLAERADEIFRATVSGRKDVRSAATSASTEQVNTVLKSYGLGIPNFGVVPQP
jgi:hypothetical protein